MVAAKHASSTTPALTYLRYLCAFAGSGFTDQHERLVMLETVQNLVTVLAYREPFALRRKIQRLVGVEDERRYVIIRWCRVPFRGKRFVIYPAGKYGRERERGEKTIRIIVCQSTAM